MTEWRNEGRNGGEKRDKEDELAERKNQVKGNEDGIGRIKKRCEAKEEEEEEGIRRENNRVNIYS